ncbi:hypothetical protein [Roseospira visakhapatnamensis]|uniref:Uncharacterized protein n=1 Tax=Roseospira visakhapatnamensis TaxID=390880 RepID=A0A7W6RD19_9PROT|nr:hypothetical protein [Roseospira visakhapatnamensis]MBB4266228.1 hypothetical protein [Roseospira visakhapatnamensis]
MPDPSLPGWTRARSRVQADTSKQDRRHLYRIGGFLLCQSRIDTGRYTRAATRLRRDGLDHMVLHLSLGGTVRTGAAPAASKPASAPASDARASPPVVAPRATARRGMARTWR